MSAHDKTPLRAERSQTTRPARELTRTIATGAAICSLLAAGNSLAAESALSRVVVVTNAEPRVRIEDFVGADACARCHRKEYALWQNSTHGQAGGEPGEVKLVARFDGKPLQFKDGQVTPMLNAQGKPVFRLEQQGLPPVDIEVYAVVGGGHMFGGGTQSFFLQFPDGTVRFLPFDFSRTDDRWFVQLRRDLTWAPVSREISLATDLANWPPHRVLGTLTELSNCQNCHGSQIATRYDDTLRRYETHYQTLRINCESCHGPGRRHLDLVSQPGFEKQPDLGMKPLALLNKDDSLKVCFQCHAKKDAIREEPYLPGEDLESYFSLKLALLGNSPFLVDGRVRSFDYQSNHQFSDCYLNGSMTCVDCHEPHSLAYRDVFGRPLTGRFDNGQCTSCHASKAIQPESHTHHQPGSPGSLCTSCHMPYLQHPGVGTRITYARSDHTIPIPRPAFDHQLGIENACHKCHRDKDLAWEETKTKEWYGEIKPHGKIIANLIQAPVVADPRSAARLLLDPTAKHSMAQMAGLAAFIQRFVGPDSAPADLEALARLKAFAASDDPDLKALALAALKFGYQDRTGVRPLLSAQLEAKGEMAEAVRRRWAIALDTIGNSFAEKGDLPGATVCFQKALEVQPDNIVILSHLSQAFLRAGRAADAVALLKKAVQLRPSKAVLYFQLAKAYVGLEQLPQARQALEEGLKYSPDDPLANRMLQQLRER